MNLDINGHHLFVSDRGAAENPAVVLLHHGLGSTRAWRRQVLPLVEAGFRLIVYDRWGYGKSDRRAALCLPHFDDDRADLLTLLDQLGVEQAALVGHSDGGTIALYIAITNPHRVSCLVTIAAHTYVEPKMLPGLVGIRQTYEGDPEFRHRFARAHGDKHQQVFDNWYKGWSNPKHLGWDLRPDLKQIRCPTLVIQGLEDEHATPKHAEDIAAAIPEAELWLVPGVGHMLQRDAAKALNYRLVGFLQDRILEQ